ncbi:hypothetical protein ABZW18_31470 [Streptomyces sp. NPDC004647]|uniref:hypothetical protein n=1 Tax=Streptomyces sp. NPDC004647 TaxID=3154671 RepID=UPI0033A3B3CC
MLELGNCAEDLRRAAEPVEFGDDELVACTGDEESFVEFDATAHESQHRHHRVSACR